MVWIVRSTQEAISRCEGMSEFNELQLFTLSSKLYLGEYFPIDIEKEALSLFESSACDGVCGIHVLSVFQRLKKSPVERDKKIFACMIRGFSSFMSTNGSSSSCSRDFAIDVEADTSSYFENVYAGQLTIEDLLNILKQFRKSSIQREQKIFECMVKHVFDDFKFFPRYLESNLRITAVLFGSLAKLRLLTFGQLSDVFYFVRCALEQDDSKTFSLGMTALEHLVDEQGVPSSYSRHCLSVIKSRETRRQTQGANLDVAQMDTNRVSVQFLDGDVPQLSQYASGVRKRTRLARTELKYIIKSDISLIDQVHHPIFFLGSEESCLSFGKLIMKDSDFTLGET